MKKSDLKAKGGFVDPKPVKKRVKCRLNGEDLEFDVWVVRQPFGVVEAAMSDAHDRRHAAQMISLCVRLGEKGEESLTYEEAFNLDVSVAWAFVQAINEAHSKN